MTSVSLNSTVDKPSSSLVQEEKKVDDTKDIDHHDDTKSSNDKDTILQKTSITKLDTKQENTPNKQNGKSKPAPNKPLKAASNVSNAIKEQEPLKTNNKAIQEILQERLATVDPYGTKLVLENMQSNQILYPKSQKVNINSDISSKNAYILKNIIENEEKRLNGKTKASDLFNDKIKADEYIFKFSETLASIADKTLERYSSFLTSKDYLNTSFLNLPSINDIIKPVKSKSKSKSKAKSKLKPQSRIDLSAALLKSGCLEDNSLKSNILEGLVKATESHVQNILYDEIKSMPDGLTPSSSISSLNTELQSVDTKLNVGEKRELEKDEEEVDSDPSPKKSKGKGKPRGIARVQPMPFYPDGRPALPIKLGVTTLNKLGTIVYDRPGYHTNRYLYPVGYECIRKFYSLINPNETVDYICKIEDGGNLPKFIVIPSDNPEGKVESTTTTGSWGRIIREANRLRGRSITNSIAGPDYFGLMTPAIIFLLQRLPNVDKCSKYEKQLFDVVAPKSNLQKPKILDEEYIALYGDPYENATKGSNAPSVNGDEDLDLNENKDDEIFNISENNEDIEINTKESIETSIETNEEIKSSDLMDENKEEIKSENQMDVEKN